MAQESLQSKLPTSPSQKSPAVSPRSGQDMDPEEAVAEEVDDPEMKDPSYLVEDTDMTVGAKLTMTYPQGLIVTVLPNGDCLQQMIKEKQMPKSQTKGGNYV